MYFLYLNSRLVASRQRSEYGERSECGTEDQDVNPTILMAESVQLFCGCVVRETIFRHPFLNVDLRMAIRTHFRSFYLFQCDSYC